MSLTTRFSCLNLLLLCSSPAATTLCATRSLQMSCTYCRLPATLPTRTPAPPAAARASPRSACRPQCQSAVLCSRWARRQCLDTATPPPCSERLRHPRFLRRRTLESPAFAAATPRTLLLNDKGRVRHHRKQHSKRNAKCTKPHNMCCCKHAPEPPPLVLVSRRGDFIENKAQ